MNKNVVACVISSILMTGCASIVSDSNYPVSISSTPPNASFIIKDKDDLEIHSGETPATVTLKSGDGYFSSASYTLIFQKEGFEDKEIIITGKMDGWYLGNIILGGLIGMLIVDPITGAMWKLPEDQNIDLDAKLAVKKDDTKLKIVSINAVPESIQNSLIKIN